MTTLRDLENDPYYRAVATLRERLNPVLRTSKHAADLKRALADLDTAYREALDANRKMASLQDTRAWQRASSSQRHDLMHEAKLAADDARRAAAEQMRTVAAVVPGVVEKIKTELTAKLEPPTDLSAEERATAREECELILNGTTQRGDVRGYMKAVREITDVYGADSAHARLLAGGWGRAHAISRNVEPGWSVWRTQRIEAAATRGTDEQRLAAQALQALTGIGESVSVISGTFAANGVAAPTQRITKITGNGTAAMEADGPARITAQ